MIDVHLAPPEPYRDQHKRTTIYTEEESSMKFFVVVAIGESLTFGQGVPAYSCCTIERTQCYFGKLYILRWRRGDDSKENPYSWEHEDDTAPHFKADG